MGKTILFGILVAIVLVSFFGVDSAQAASKPKPTKTKTATKTKVVPTMTPTPKPQPTQVAAPDFNWQSENNPALLSETGDYTMAWWSWFKFRPAEGAGAFFLMNHFKDKSNRFGTATGSAFSPNGQVPEIVSFSLGERKVVFEVYRNAMLIAPWSGRCIVAAQISGPKVGKWGLPAGVNLFLSESSFQAWLERYR